MRQQRHEQACLNSAGRSPYFGKEEPTATSTITSKGQITIPKSVREDLGAQARKPGAFLKNAEGFYELRHERRSVKDLEGSLRYAGPAKSIEEMDDASVVESMH